MPKKFKRFLSVVLVLVLCISYCNVMPVYAIEEIETSIDPCYNEVKDIVANKETEKIVVSDTFMSYVDKSAFDSYNYTERLVEQEELNTYVFRTADRTTSVYYFSENLKYIDDSGKIIEKDLSIIESKNGYTIKKSNIDILLPNAPTSGIDVGYDDFSINIVPISTSKVTSLEKIKAEKADGSVVYNGIFGENTKLVYTPILSGLKEDIILSEYVPNARFSFTIKTNGLSIAEKDGKYYLAEAGKSEQIFKLGDVVAYDAVGKPSIGRMTVKTVKASSEYVVTLEVDEEFLKDSGTVYPITINPTITVSDNTSGAGAIEDAPIYQGYPTRNFGTYLFNPVGTPSADFGVGRTAVKLTGLISSTPYTNTSVNQITNVTFYVKEGSGGSPQNVYLSPLVTNLTWTESNVTWNNVGLNMPLANYGGILSGGQWTGFDITNLVKAWKVDSYPASGGFIMKGLDDTLNRTFLSSEYSTTSYRPYVVMTYEGTFSGGDSFDNAENITLNKYYGVNIGTYGEGKYFKFVPSTTGYYTFESTSNLSGNPRGALFNSSRNEIANNDNGSSNYNFRLTYHLIGGVTYYFKADCVGSSTGIYDFRVVKTTSSSSVSISSSLNIGSQSSVSINFPYEAKFYKFEPPVTGEYMFVSSDNSDIPRVWCYDSSLNLVGSSYNAGIANTNFELTVELDSDKTYYIVAGQFSSTTGNYKFKTYRSLTYVHYYDSSFASNATLLGNVSEANVFADDVYSNYFGLKMKMNGSASQYSTVIDNCPTGMHNECTAESCGEACDWNHHKNIYTVAQQLLGAPREDNHLYVLWTDRDSDTYCSEYSTGHTTIPAIACVCNNWPVIHFMEIRGSTTYKQKICMELVLVHETAHSLGLDDVYYDNSHEQNACVMSNLDMETADEYYQDILDGRAEPFCDSCEQAINQLVLNTVIEGN